MDELCLRGAQLLGYAAIARPDFQGRSSDSPLEILPCLQARHKKTPAHDHSWRGFSSFRLLFDGVAFAIIDNDCTLTIFQRRKADLDLASPYLVIDALAVDVLRRVVQHSSLSRREATSAPTCLAHRAAPLVSSACLLT